MGYEILLIEEEQAVEVYDDKGNFIALDFPNKEAFNQIKAFLEEGRR